jgi:hypothetical protein
MDPTRPEATRYVLHPPSLAGSQGPTKSVQPPGAPQLLVAGSLASAWTGHTYGRSSGTPGKRSA